MSARVEAVADARRHHVIGVQAVAIGRLTAAQAKARGVAPDQPEADEIHSWAAGLPHVERIACLYRLGERTDDLWLDLRGILAQYRGQRW